MATVTIPEAERPQGTAKWNSGDVSEGRGEWRVVFRGVDWETYSKLVDSCSEGSPLTLAFDGQDLEIMTKGNEHEVYKVLIGRMIDAITEEFGIPLVSVGETTWKRPNLKRGLEVDQSYYFSEAKQNAAKAALARHSNQVVDYPNPDLAIEIDLSPSQVDRPAIYAALQIPEIWRFGGNALVMERLTEDGRYIEVERSGFLPIDASEVASWLIDGHASDATGWIRRFRAWIRAELLPRAGDAK